jgi:peptide/nickel transport system ATP-binding protein
MRTPPASVAAPPVLQIEHLKTVFETGDGVVTAVDDVSLAVRPGEILGIVGESGCGKTVTGYSIMGLVAPPGRIEEGSIRLRGRELTGLSDAEMRHIRGNRIALICQDPMSALHPLLRIGAQMVDAICGHRRVSRDKARREAAEMLERVGIPSPDERLKAYPHQLSGGMRQRVCIAIAMLNKPDVIIADEPTTALDVTTQAQILHEMRLLCEGTGTAVLWITHDLAVVSEIAHRIAVMYAGSIVEEGPVDAVLDAPLHPYTIGLLGSVPSRNRHNKRLTQLGGSVASAADATGCRFAPRCSLRMPECGHMPSLTRIDDARKVRCFAAERPAPAQKLLELQHDG